MLIKIRLLYALVALSALLTSESGYASAFRGEGHYRRIVQEDSGTQALATLVEGILALQQASPPLTPPTPTPEGAPLPLSPFPSPSPPLPSPPPECPPLPSLEVVPPGLGQAWEGSLESGLAGLSPALGGNITDLQDRLAVIVDRDPTAPADVAKNVMMVTYQPGMAGPQGGASFFIYPFGRDSTLGNSVRLQYKVMFEVGFDWSRGGTLPGLFQGPVSDDVDQQPCFRAWQAGAQGVDCFAIRPQWKAGGNIELSMHVPLGSQTCQFEEEAKGWQNPNSGVLLSQKGTPRLQRLKWHEFDIFVQLNDVGQANGQVLLTVDGAPLLSFPQVVIRTSQEQTVDAISFASFYIGTANTAPSKEQHVLFKDLRIETGPQEQLPPPFAPPPFSAPAPAPASFPPSPPPSPPPFPPPPPPPSPPPPTPPSPPPPSPPPCRPLRSTAVVAPDLVLKWMGDLDQGLAGMAMGFGGNITDQLDRQAVVVDRDPTLPESASSNVIMVTYQPGMAGPQGGASFFIYPFGRDSTLGNSVRLQYKVMFEDGFDWNRGGTLPGLFQGPVSDDVDQQPCFGGWQAGQRGVDCFAFRPQWRAGGKIEFSMHIPQIRQICQLREESKGWGNPNRGILLSNPKGPAMEVLRWYLFDIFVQLNDVGRANGRVLLSVNGIPQFSFPRLVIRTSEEQTVDAISFASHYIGTANTAPFKEQHVLFKDFRILAGYMESPEQAASSPPPFPPLEPSTQLPTPAPAEATPQEGAVPLPEEISPQ